MKLESKLKNHFLYQKDNIIKKIYVIINSYFSALRDYKKSYSQGAMDLILNNIFSTKKNGFYVDVGCQHPIKNNNTYLLHKKGWKGVNIDLDKFCIDLFNYNRPKDFNINAAISDKVEETNLYFYHHKSAINTLNKNISDLQKAKISSIKKIWTKTLNQILKQAKCKKIDLLTIDVEGNEYKVLKRFDFTKFDPKIIVVEFLDLAAYKWEIPYNNINKVKKSHIYNLLIRKNYNLVNWVNGDLVFSKKNFKLNK